MRGKLFIENTHNIDVKDDRMAKSKDLSYNQEAQSSK